MKDQNIEELVSNIDGAFPSARMFVKNVIKTYKREQFMRDMTPDEGRKLYNTIIDECDNAPSLGEVKSLYHRYVRKPNIKPNCDQCDNTGWITPYYDDGSPMTRPSRHGLHDKEGNLLQYTYVLPCVCREVK